MEQPQRCVVAKCGRVPTQIERYETRPDEGDGVATYAVCAGHTGMGDPTWRLAGVDYIPGRLHYAQTPERGANA